MKQITLEDVSNWVPVREKDTYKNKMGHVLCVGGNENMGGAIILSASAALNAGAGLVTVASAPENMHALHARNPEAMFVNMYDVEAVKEILPNVDVIVLGPGMGTSKQSTEVFHHIIDGLNENQWLILDGDGITHYVNHKNSLDVPTDKVIFTPHPGEWKRLTDIAPPAEDLEENKQQAYGLDAVIVLKKERTEIYIDDEVWQNTAGNPSMATGGMGDTLTGILASFLGQFQNKKQAILSAVYVHSAVADELAETHYVTLPTKIIQSLPKFINKITKN
ncbi:MAG TPA: NAD(P)H-hydrate dehydratase [Atopostipes sp.]|nr:NAD(P)H-hydrate dehydratase [Atopostipes sp.]